MSFLPKLGAEVGKGLGGLPKRKSSGGGGVDISLGRVKPTVPTMELILTAGIIVPPEGAKYMRVASIGSGGGGRASASTNIGGGGGGCAATGLIKAQVFTIDQIGVGGTGTGCLRSGYTTPATGTDTIVTIGSDYVLVGGAGGTAVSSSTSGARGFPSGGDYNFLGGSGFRRTQSSYGSQAGGGGAAGPNGGGGTGVGHRDSGTASSVSSSTPIHPIIPSPSSAGGWGPCGGTGGGIYRFAAGGGAGPGGASVYYEGYNGDTYRLIATGGFFSVMQGFQFDSDWHATWAGIGSIPGGGGGALGASRTGDSEANGANGGQGGVIVEWFF